ncbi:hypothetical protein SCALIN_C27_0150 [Candidatus Scalindua japonica]|uniref:DUF3179 domain-containing protein n=1 Tax=Candidatus Scalindua japonica TaxID=1284222 RepID=A0A286U0S8_9BACT|nr:DUF3179 domain-containing protein [Candidatus Scalindua japonica]GAX61753.1 hypothetical protein SCALIN_C27_0150 [Candidatus Scalindua japonica]
MLIEYSLCRKHLCLFYLALCFSIFSTRLCWANTLISQKEDEIQNALPRDTIPAIKNPDFVHAEEAGLDENEPVVGITINDENRAYSVYLLNHHEIVNDRIGDTAIAVTWCPLANLAVVYNREIDSKEYTFGVSGNLLKNTLVMFDYETESLWPIVYGESIKGTLTGKKLKQISGCQKIPWGAWKKSHPDSLVLSHHGSRTVGYDVYGDYHKNEERGIFPAINIDQRLGVKANIIGIEIKGRHKAYPFYLFNNTPIITDEFQGVKLLVYRNNDTGIINVYDRQLDGVVIDFAEKVNNTTDTVTNTTWDMENGIGIKGNMKGRTLLPVNFLSVYWFVWADYFPDTEIFH